MRGSGPPEAAAASARAMAFRYRREGFGVIFPFAMPSSAGTIDREIITAIATAPEAPMPMTVRNGMPARERPRRAIITVSPAKTTADPAVAVARPAASWGSRPSARSERARETMKSA